VREISNGVLKLQTAKCQPQQGRFNEMHDAAVSMTYSEQTRPYNNNINDLVNTNDAYIFCNLSVM